MASNNLKSEALFKKIKLIKVDQEIHSFCFNQDLKLPLVFICPDSLIFERSMSWLTSSIDKFNKSDTRFSNLLNLTDSVNFAT